MLLDRDMWLIPNNRQSSENIEFTFELKHLTAVAKSFKVPSLAIQTNDPFFFDVSITNYVFEDILTLEPVMWDLRQW